MSPTDKMDFLTAALQLFQDRIPFHRTLGFEIDFLTPEPVDTVAVASGQVVVKFDFREELVGNYVRGSLHGGVISAVLDAVGGLVAYLSLLERLEGQSNEAKIARLGSIGTIDLRVDYLRSGIGKAFLATGHVLRSGNKVTVTRMELHNDGQTLIAVGTGTYIVG